MSDKKELPLSGYSLVGVYPTMQEMRQKDPAADKEQGGVTFGWDWRLTSDEDLFEVQLNIAVEPTKERDDYAAVSVVGRFRKLGVPSLELAQFVQLQAVAILLPFVRQTLSNLTVMTFHGAYYLPPVNVVTLMKDFSFDQTTGSRQMSERQKGEVAKSTPKKASRAYAIRHK